MGCHGEGLYHVFMVLTKVGEYGVDFYLDGIKFEGFG